jgi:predicted phage tail protein
MQGLLAGVTFFFWARLVDRTGNIGPWYPAGMGVMGQSCSDAGAILDMIAGQIGETELGQDLQDKIDKIDDLQEQIDALDGLKAYNPDQAYSDSQMVVLNDRIYQAVGAVPVNTPPPDPAHWIDVGQSVETATGLAQELEQTKAEVDALAAQVTSTQTLRAAYREDNGEGDLADALKGWTSTASIATESKVRASETEATARQIVVVTAQVNDNVAQVTDLKQSVATDKAATATALTQVNARVDDNTSSIQETATAYADTSGKLSTMWSVKMQVTAGGQYVAAGIGLGVENTGAGLQSQFLVSADRFAIVNTIAGGAISVPFAVQGGQVFINQAFIADGTITNAKIGSYISSTNYIAGQLGWILNKDGTLEINGAIAGQGRLVVNNQYIAVYDANNVLRVKLGNLA